MTKKNRMKRTRNRVRAIIMAISPIFLVTQEEIDEQMKTRQL
jgi:hypothetical protein